MAQNHTNIDELVEVNKNPSPFLGAGSPEHGPGRTFEPNVEAVEKSHEDVEIHEVVEHEHEPDPEVDKHIEVRKEKPDIPEDVEKMGAQAATPQHFTTTQKIQLPISDDKVMAGKKAPVTSSLRWLAEFCLYILKRAHIQLKEAHGKAQRIFKP